MRHLLAALLLVLLAAPLSGQASRDCTTTNTVIINCGDINSLDGLSALTVAAWVQGDTDSTFRWIFAKWGNSASVSTWSLGRTTSVDFGVAAGSTSYTATGTTAVQTNTRRYCLVGTYDSARTDAVELEAWVDGVREAQAAGPNSALNASAESVGVCNRAAGGTNDWEEEIAHVVVEARAWSEAEIKDYCRGNLAVAQRAAGGTGGYLPLWDPEADPGTYRGMGLFAGTCSASTDPSASTNGPPVFIPAGGGQ